MGIQTMERRDPERKKRNTESVSKCEQWRQRRDEAAVSRVYCFSCAQTRATRENVPLVLVRFVNFREFFGWLVYASFLVVLT